MNSDRKWIFVSQKKGPFHLFANVCVSTSAYVPFVLLSRQIWIALLFSLSSYEYPEEV